MTKNYSTPLTVSIANKSNTKQFFVPHMENQVFPIEASGQVSFEVRNSEVGLYYENQISKDLSVAVAESSNVSLECGSGYDLDTFEKGASFSAILESKSENTCNYSVIGTLPYSDATPSIGMPAGNRFTARFVNPDITDRADLPGGKICRVTKVGGLNSDNEYTKSAFEDDGSLILVVNSEPTSTITVSIKWVEGTTTIYHFTFENVKLGTDGETLENVQNIAVSLPATITLEAAETVSFIPYHENFEVSIEKGNELVFMIWYKANSFCCF